jgi:hypothetical protein
MVAMSFTGHFATLDALDSQTRLLFSAQRILDESIAMLPAAPPRFHWRGDAREAYAARLLELSAMMQRAEAHLEAATHAIAVISHV